METGLRILLLSAALGALVRLRHACATGSTATSRSRRSRARTSAQAAEADEADERAAARHRARGGAAPIKVPRIDTENVEIGGVLRRALHRGFRHQPGVRRHAPPTTSRRTSSSRPKRAAPRPASTSFETLGGNIQLLTGDERQFTYYNLALGYNFLPGEVFLGRGLAMTSAFYLIGGIGSIEFAGDQTVHGELRRGLPRAADGLARDPRRACRIACSTRTCSATSKLTNNLEANIGVTVFF